MKRLRVIALSVSIFAIAAFGCNQCAILIHKAGTAGLWRNIQISWNRSLAETGKELNSFNAAFPPKRNREFDAMAQHAIRASVPPDHSKSIVDWSKRLETTGITYQ
jgi:hypothetical protein